MRLRIAIWSGVGALVVVFWTLYITATSTTPHGIVWILIYLTCPIVLAHHYGLGFYLVLLVNAATYALVGLIFETMRRRYKSRMISN